MKISRTMKIILTVLLLGLVVQQIMSKEATDKTETPEYIVLKKYESFEIRQYPELILATTNMGNTYSGNSGNGFRTVAGYIFGGNESNEKISMTSPVMVEMSDSVKMSFIMPSEYDLEKLPKPDNPEVQLRTENSKIVAVIQYGGFSNESKMGKYKLKLIDELESNNLTPIGSFMFYGYNPPYQLINRRNEVAVEIEWIDNDSSFNYQP